MTQALLNLSKLAGSLVLATVSVFALACVLWIASAFAAILGIGAG